MLCSEHRSSTSLSTLGPEITPDLGSVELLDVIESPAAIVCITMRFQARLYAALRH